MLTLDEVKNTLPPHLRSNLSQHMVNELNSLSKDPEEARYMRDNFIGFSQVLAEGQFKLSDYVKAIMYCSHKVMGKSNQQSYKETFPERHQTMVDKGYDSKRISSVVAGYNKGGLVSKIMERAMVPSWLLNQDMFQSALNTQFELMTDITISPKVRSDAAHSLLTTLKRPEVNKAELKVDIAVNDGMAALEEAVANVSRQQLNMIELEALTPEQVAKSPMKAVN